jgi:glutathione S-transferase
MDERALARSISNEMHSGFFAIRNTLHMNCSKSIKFMNITKELKVDIARVCEIWKLCRKRHSNSGKFLFGEFSIADAMYAHIVLRFNSYQIDVGDIEKEYMNNILAIPSLKEWIAEGIQEKEHLPQCEVQSE